MFPAEDGRATRSRRSTGLNNGGREFCRISRHQKLGPRAEAGKSYRKWRGVDNVMEDRDLWPESNLDRPAIAAGRAGSVEIPRLVEMVGPGPAVKTLGPGLVVDLGMVDNRLGGNYKCHFQNDLCAISCDASALHQGHSLHGMKCHCKALLSFGKVNIVAVAGIELDIAVAGSL